ncbi:hypothetical protein HC928_25295 [bacterium]|nr:hypothetical protein [bacterium]
MMQNVIIGLVMILFVSGGRWRVWSRSSDGGAPQASVLRREERGFGSVSMGRLLVSGMGGGAAFMLASLMQLRLLMIPLALGVFIGGLVLTHPRHGIPLYLYLLVTIRTRLLLASARPTDWLAVTGDRIARTQTGIARARRE